MRENGAVFFGEVYVIPDEELLETGHLISKIEEANAGVKKLDWKVHDIVIQPVRSFK